MTMRAKETSYGTTQTACYSRSTSRPTVGRRRREDVVREGRPAGRVEEGAGRAGVERGDGSSPGRRRGGDGRANSRNGYGKKQVLTETGKIALEVPRDRLSTFDPQLIAKYQRRFPGFDEKIISMYA